MLKCKFCGNNISLLAKIRQLEEIETIDTERKRVTNVVTAPKRRTNRYDPGERIIEYKCPECGNTIFCTTDEMTIEDVLRIIKRDTPEQREDKKTNEEVEEEELIHDMKRAGIDFDTSIRTVKKRNNIVH